MVEHQYSKTSSCVTSSPSGNHGHPIADGVVFSKDLGQLEFRSVSVVGSLGGSRGSWGGGVARG